MLTFSIGKCCVCLNMLIVKTYKLAGLTPADIGLFETEMLQRLNLRPQGFEFRILYLEGSVICHLAKEFILIQLSL